MAKKANKIKTADKLSKGMLSYLANQVAQRANISKGVATDVLLGRGQISASVARDISRALPFVGAQKLGGMVFVQR